MDSLVVNGAKRNHSLVRTGKPPHAIGIAGHVMQGRFPAADKATHLRHAIHVALLHSIRPLSTTAL